jgi:antibiotic biosynthesis monooxygenase (ABM) superfamily enzyme
MDPDAALKELLEAVEVGDCDRVTELADGLKQWLAQGGFPPKTIGRWKLGQVWHVAMTHAVIRHARAHVRVIANQIQAAEPQ